MHEYPITQRIVEIACDYARESGAKKVVHITLVAGDAAGYVPDTVKLYFDEIAMGTLCEGANLEIKRVIPKLRCKACGELFVRKPFEFTCPICAGEGEPTQIGREFYMESITVEEKE